MVKGGVSFLKEGANTTKDLDLISTPPSSSDSQLCNSSSGRSDTLLWLLQVLHSFVQTHK